MLLIAAPTPAELAALAPAIFTTAEVGEMRPLQKSIKNGEAIFMATGVGPINAALGIGFCLGQYNSPKNGKYIDAVLYAGVAGAFDLEKTPLRSIWHVATEIWPEYGLNDGATITARAFSSPLWTREDGETVYDRLDLDDFPSLGLKGIKPDLWPECVSLTVAGATASFARREFLWSAFHAGLENMEGFAAAYAAARMGRPCVEIRVIDRKTGPRGRAEKDHEGALLELGEILPSLNLAQRAKKICH